MSALFGSATVRAVLIACILAAAAAFTAPTARGAEADGGSKAAVSQLETQSSLLPAAVLADEFTWSEFVRYWSRQLGSVQGVVGTVLLIAGTAFLIILSKGKA
jgi:hypothetical protein